MAIDQIFKWVSLAANIAQVVAIVFLIKQIRLGRSSSPDWSGSPRPVCMFSQSRGRVTGYMR